MGPRLGAAIERQREPWPAIRVAAPMRWSPAVLSLTLFAGVAHAETPAEQIRRGFHPQARTEYAEAASWHERFARASPATEKAPAVLQSAIVLRLATGDPAQAERDADLFVKT